MTPSVIDWKRTTKACHLESLPDDRDDPGQQDHMAIYFAKLIGPVKCQLAVWFQSG